MFKEELDPPFRDKEHYVDDLTMNGRKRFVSDKEHKFFYRDLNLDLKRISDDLHLEYERIKNAEMRGVAPFNRDKAYTEFFKESNSISTIKSREYSVFMMYYPWAHDLFTAVTSMAQEACEYYGVDYNDYRFISQSWFNINSKEKGGKLHFHDHTRNDFGDIAFHGYFSVSAEPSQTHYDIDGTIKINENKNNRAILSKTGYPHAQGDWDWDGPRITIAYDVIPLHTMQQNAFLKMPIIEETDKLWEQHYNPMPRIIK